MESKGWSVIIVWECELTKAKFGDTLGRVSDEIIEYGDLYKRQIFERRIERERRINKRKAAMERRQALMTEIKFKG